MPDRPRRCLVGIQVGQENVSATAGGAAGIHWFRFSVNDRFGSERSITGSHIQRGRTGPG